VVLATEGPLCGRWKIYIDDRYRGSGPDKISARNAALDMAKMKYGA
jgi:hypothetical protein